MVTPRTQHDLVPHKQRLQSTINSAQKLVTGTESRPGDNRMSSAASQTLLWHSLRLCSEESEISPAPHPVLPVNGRLVSPVRTTQGRHQRGRQPTNVRAVGRLTQDCGLEG